MPNFQELEHLVSDTTHFNTDDILTYSTFTLYARQIRDPHTLYEYMELNRICVHIPAFWIDYGGYYNSQRSFREAVNTLEKGYVRLEGSSKSSYERLMLKMLRIIKRELEENIALQSVRKRRTLDLSDCLNSGQQEIDEDSSTVRQRLTQFNKELSPLIEIYESSRVDASLKVSTKRSSGFTKPMSWLGILEQLKTPKTPRESERVGNDDVGISVDSKLSHVMSSIKLQKTKNIQRCKDEHSTKFSNNIPANCHTRAIEKRLKTNMECSKSRPKVSPREDQPVQESKCQGNVSGLCEATHTFQRRVT